MNESRYSIKRKADLQVISSWIEPEQTVLDLGCGRGLFLEHLQRTRRCHVVGVDLDTKKVLACIDRGVPVYQGDMMNLLSKFEDGYFDWVVCSRTLQELDRPANLLLEALRVGNFVAVGFANFGYWVNRWATFTGGLRVVNDVFPDSWEDSRALNPVSINAFRRFCQERDIHIVREQFLAGDWHSPLTFWPNLLAGYGLFCLTRKHGIEKA